MTKSLKIQIVNVKAKLRNKKSNSLDFSRLFYVKGSSSNACLVSQKRNKQKGNICERSFFETTVECMICYIRKLYL